jgi:hypothetical protein
VKIVTARTVKKNASEGEREKLQTNKLGTENNIILLSLYVDFSSSAILGGAVDV